MSEQLFKQTVNTFLEGCMVHVVSHPNFEKFATRTSDNIEKWYKINKEYFAEAIFPKEIKMLVLQAANWELQDSKEYKEIRSFVKKYKAIKNR